MLHRHSPGVWTTRLANLADALTCRRGVTGPRSPCNLPSDMGHRWFRRRWWPFPSVAGPRVSPSIRLRGDAGPSESPAGRTADSHEAKFLPRGGGAPVACRERNDVMSADRKPEVRVRRTPRPGLDHGFGRRAASRGALARPSHRWRSNRRRAARSRSIAADLAPPGPAEWPDRDHCRISVIGPPTAGGRAEARLS